MAQEKRKESSVGLVTTRRGATRPQPEHQSQEEVVDQEKRKESSVGLVTTRRRATRPRPERQSQEGVVDQEKRKGSVYRVTELVGTSSTSWEDAARSAVQAAARTLRDLRVAEVTKTDLVIKDGKVVAYRVRVSLSFKYEG